MGINISKEVDHKQINGFVHLGLSKTIVERPQSMAVKDAANLYPNHWIYILCALEMPDELEKHLRRLKRTGRLEIDFKDVHGYSALDYVCTFERSHDVYFLVEILLEFNINPNSSVWRDGAQWSPLRCAVNSKNLKLAALLIDNRAQVDWYHPRCSFTALMEAIQKNWYPGAKYLIEKGANINHLFANAAAYTPLTYAGFRYREIHTDARMLQLLIEKGGRPTLKGGNGHNLWYYVPENNLTAGEQFPPPLKFRDRETIEDYDEEFECPICSNIMEQPAMDHCGCIYDLVCLRRSLSTLRVCPKTRRAYPDMDFRPCRTLQNLIEKWAREHDLLE